MKEDMGAMMLCKSCMMIVPVNHICPGLEGKTMDFPEPIRRGENSAREREEEMECQLTAKLARSEQERTAAVRSGSRWYTLAHSNAAKIVEKNAAIKKLQTRIAELEGGINATREAGLSSRPRDLDNALLALFQLTVLQEPTQGDV